MIDEKKVLKKEVSEVSRERLGEILGTTLQEYISDSRAQEYIHELLLQSLTMPLEPFNTASIRVWNAPRAKERTTTVKELKSVGDTLLFYLGLFPETVERQKHGAPGISWYTAVGASSYCLAAKCSEESGQFALHQELFQHLGEEFLSFVNAVQLTRAKIDYSAKGELRFHLLKEQELPLPTQRTTGFYFGGIPYTREGKIIIS
ncbi:hypothetical protein HYX13_03295 [Candidatus Woesearchaeota archaeon]|nr:hypothetical protein [Candidatus Woesearchaeota archaeon]